MNTALIRQSGFKNHFSSTNLMALQALFSDEQDYTKHLNSLRKTRSGLMKIIEMQPELKGSIKPQFDIINLLIDALL
jgi:hypothetical protein